MTDAASATDKAIYDALVGAIVGADIYQHVSQDAPLPVVIIGDMDQATPLSGKAADRSRQIPLSIVVVTEGESRKPCAALQGQVEAVLGGATLATVPGWSIRPVFSASSCVLADDGLGYIGLSQFNVFAIAD